MLGRYVADDPILVMFYVAAVQSVMLYGLEMWVISLSIGKIMGVFHHRVAHILMRRKP